MRSNAKYIRGFLYSYAVFSAAILMICLIAPEYGRQSFAIWYRVTSFLRVILGIAMIVLSVKLIKLLRLRKIICSDG